MAPLIHQLYPKIGELLTQSTAGGEWVATEKIHGANLVVATDGEEVRIGKRKAWLEEDEPFFGWQRLRSGLTHAARTIHEQLGGRGTLRVYGELFGGGYPHPDVAGVPGMTAVQTGIWYAPDLHFAVFDILVEPDTGAATFVHYDEMCRLAELGALLTAPQLGRGRYPELQRISPRFTTKVPSRLGLPAIDGNFAEGLVLKPVGSFEPEKRPAAKRKIEEFRESRFDESHPFDPDVHLTVDDLLVLSTSMMNPVRIASARSKVGTVPGLVLEEAVLDVWIDLESMFPSRMKTLLPHEEERIRETLLQAGVDHVQGAD